MMADSIRFGKVSNINYKTGCMEVTYEDREDSVTDMIPMLANAGYKMPKVGDTVVVAHNSNGEEEGVVLGTTWGENENPPEGAETFTDRTSMTNPGSAISAMTERKPPSTMRATRSRKPRRTKRKPLTEMLNWK